MKSKQINDEKNNRVISGTTVTIDPNLYDIDETDVVLEVTDNLHNLATMIYNEEVDIETMLESIDIYKYDDKLFNDFNKLINTRIYSKSKVKEMVKSIANVHELIKFKNENLKRIVVNIALKSRIRVEIKETLQNLIKNKVLGESERILVLLNGSDYFEFGDSFDLKIRVDKKSYAIAPIPSASTKSQRSLKLLIDNEINFLELRTSELSNFDDAKIFVVTISSLLESMKTNFEAIFIDNVRLYVRNLNVDNAINNSIINEPNDFHVLHNGISIVCKGYKFIDKHISLDDASVVNGAQTLYNIRKMLKFGIIESRNLERIYLVTKVLKLRELSRISSKDISEAANTQKSVTEFDLKSNHEYSRIIASYFESRNVILIIKRNDDINHSESIHTYELIKILFACYYQRPGYARNAKRDDLFSDENNYFNQLYFCDEDALKIRFKYFVYEISELWKIYKQKSLDQETSLFKFSDKYACAWTFGQFIMRVFELKLEFEKIDEIYFNSFLEESNSIFKNFITSYETAKKEIESKGGFIGSNDFKNEDLYTKMFPKSNIVAKFVQDSRFFPLYIQK